MEENQKRYDSINIMRVICAFLVISLHTSFFASVDLGLNNIVAKGISRIAVPFFFISTGYFMVKNITKNGYVKGFVKRIGLIYLLISLIDIILIMPYVSMRLSGDFAYKIKYIFIGGIIESLWYIPAIIFAVVLVSIFLKKNWIKPLIVVSILLYIIGLLGDSYFGLIKNTPLEVVINFYNNIFINTRNGITFSIPFVTLGALIAKGNIKLSKNIINICLIVFSIIFALEAYFLNLSSISLDTNMYMTLLLLVPVIFIWLLNMNIEINERTSNILREMSLWIYCVHETIMLIVMMYMGSKNTILMFLEVSLISTLIAYLIARRKVKVPVNNIKRERRITTVLLILSLVFLFTNNANKNSQAANNQADLYNSNGEPTDIIGPLYKVSDDNSSIYIYQSFGFGTKDMYPLNPEVKEAFDNSEAIVLETEGINMQDKNIMDILTYGSDDSIENHVSKEAIEILKEVAKDAGVEFKNLEKYKAYIISLVLQQYIIDKDAMLFKYSPQGYLSSLALEEKKETIYMVEPIEYFKNSLEASEKVGDEFIKLTKYYKYINKENITKSIELWKSADVENLNKYDYVYESLDNSNKEEYKKLADIINDVYSDFLNKQKDIYVGKAKEYMKEDKEYFIVLSDISVTGEQGILETLTKEGYKVEKISK
ncbi:acyltransferase family protein [Clostridium sp.]|uniref:acyltransferase family protein n=1 Tax=Clostridium sp. TaxID=1506 RepID=UPI0029074CB7|nr:acyltransferase family protein [Clostridium sp.]MDU5105330.1 TraB/GumN family protein [Clostridium sp.]